MNYSAFSLSFCFFTFCSLVLWNLPREVGWVKGSHGCGCGLRYFAHTSLSLFCLKRQGWVQGHMCCCHHPHFCSKCNRECQLSICLCLAGACAQDPASGYAAPAPSDGPPLSAGAHSRTECMSSDYACF